MNIAARPERVDIPNIKNNNKCVRLVYQLIEHKHVVIFGTNDYRYYFSSVEV